MDRFVHIQYDRIVESGPNVHRDINSFVDLESILSDSESTSYGEHAFYADYLSSESEESDEIPVESLTVARAEHTDCLSTIDESSKRKLEEPGCSEQNHTSAEVENSKRIKMLSQNSENETVPSTSSQCDFDSCDTVSSTSRGVSILQDSVGSETEDFIDAQYSFSSNDDDDNDSDGDMNNDSTVKKGKYNFIFQHNKNELSQLLKSKIYSLQLPGPLKRFLNYHRTD